jgi:hypothetical protein
MAHEYSSPINTTAAIDDALAGRLGKQPAKDLPTRKKIEDAMAAAQARLDYDTKVGADYAPGCSPRQYQTLIEAARKHLETLPKPKTMWRVSYVTPSGQFDYRQCPSEQTALDCALLRLKSGCPGVGIVTIEQVS